ncbi:MAG: dTDP-4-dehydrorhamnose 3,5-epimerase [Burkholderiales bacterium]|nr:MAG: dTDP-4-dehydrorhamnose 3,5-epimerase [Burkholderiales bacterium]
MEVRSLKIPEVLLLKPKRFGDERGFFSEVFKESQTIAAGIIERFIQDNHSFSAERGVIRGLHFQVPPKAQGKLIRVIRGAIFDVALDIRQGSPTYGQHVSAELSADNWSQLWVPPGFAHGFCTLEPNVEVIYKVTAEYSPADEGGVLWNDAALGIGWPISADEAVLSGRDTKWPLMADLESPFRYAGS